MNSTPTKNILIIGTEINPIPPVNGGAVEQLVNYLIEENEINCFSKLTIVSPYNKDAKQQSGKYINTNFIFIKNNILISKLISFMDLFSRKFFNRSMGNAYIKKINKIINYNEYDIVIVENRPPYGPLIRPLYRGKLLLHLHNDTVNSKTKNVHSIVDSFDKFIVISNFLKKQIENIKHVDIDIVYNGVELNRFSNVKPYKSGIKKLLYVGRINKDKGIIELLKAYRNIDNNNSCLDIIGTFDYYSKKDNNFINEFNELIKSKNINYLGYIPNDQLPMYCSETYIGIVPTIVNEALSITAIEMLSSGIPVIYSNVGGLSEVIGDECGIKVDTDNIVNNLQESVLNILNDPETRNKLSINTKLNISRFSKEEYIKNFINMLR